MRSLVQTKFFNLLSETGTCEVLNSKISEAYDEFVEKVLTFLDDNYQNLIRRLNFTRIELVYIHQQFLCGEGEK